VIECIRDVVVGGDLYGGPIEVPKGRDDCADQSGFADIFRAAANDENSHGLSIPRFRNSVASGDETQAVPIGVFDVHLAATPCLIDWRDNDGDMPGSELPMELIDIVDHEIGDASGNAVAIEGRKMDPDAVARDAQVARVRCHAVRAMLKLELKPQALAIKHDRLGRPGYV
jgi:hypothetical protein